jgi:hypothetical protein
LEDAAYQKPGTVQFLQDLLPVGSSPQPDRQLELVLLDRLLAQNSSAKQAPPTSNPNKPASMSPTKSESANQPSPAKVELQPATEVAASTAAVKPKPKVAAQTASPHIEFSVEAWPVVLATIKKKYNTLYGILRMAHPRVEGSKLILSCTFGFHQKQINDSKNRKLISDVIKQQTGQDVEIECIIQPKDQPPAAPETTIANVSDIFGGVEVLES